VLRNGPSTLYRYQIWEQVVLLEIYRESRSRNPHVSRPLPGSLYFRSRKFNNDIIIVTYMSVYRRSLDMWRDLLTTYTLTTHDYTLQITDTHRLAYSVYYISTSHFLATYLNTETVTVPLNCTLQISHINSSLHSRTFN
jgi:hypothetical protein